MNIAIVVGFLDPVWLKLEQAYSAQIQAKSLILVKPIHPDPIPRIADFSARLAEASSRADSVLIIAARLVNYEW